MKVFISWSGEESKKVALLLKPWLKKLLQASEPWMSDTDIEPGTRWSEKIAVELRDTGFGLLCVTSDNRSSEWLNFEAGALSMAIDDIDRRVVPLLLGYDDRSALSASPLGVFNSVLFSKEDMWKLVLTMNGQLAKSLDGEDLKQLFDAFWPQLEKGVNEVLTGRAPKTPKKTQTQMTEEILHTVQSIHRNQRREISAPAKVGRPYRDESLSDSRGEMVRRHRLRMTDRLSRGEKRVLAKVAEGLSDDQIAQALNLEPVDVEAIIYKLFARLDVTNRAELLIFAHQAVLSDHAELDRD